MVLRRLVVRRCNVDGDCDNAVVAAFGTQAECWSCVEHLEQSLRELGMPTVVVDWNHVDQGLFDPAQIASQMDAAIATSETWSIEESHARWIPRLFDEVLDLEAQEDWPVAIPGVFQPTAGPKPANKLWSMLMGADPTDPNVVARVPMSKDNHRLPIELLRAVLDLLQSERAKAFLADVLWCATADKSLADEAIRAHTSCALHDEPGAQLLAVESFMINSDPVQHVKDMERRTERFRLSHLRRAAALAQLFGDQKSLEALFDHAHSLLASRKLSGGDPMDILHAVSPALDRVPDWWDAAAEGETKRIEQLPNAPIQSWLDEHYQLRINRAKVLKDVSLVASLVERHVRNYWFAVENSPANGFVKSGWARRAHDIAVSHAPHLVAEARSRYDAIDKSDGMTMSSFEVPIDPLLLNYREALLKVVDALPNTLGAEQLQDGTYRVMRSPAGLVFCFVSHQTAGVRPTPVMTAGVANLVDQVAIDVPRALFNNECQFWAGLTGWELKPGAMTEFAFLARPDGMPLRILLQQLGENDDRSTATAHLDIACGSGTVDVADEHVRLGASIELRGARWITMIDPSGFPYCLTERNPTTGVLS